MKHISKIFTALAILFTAVSCNEDITSDIQSKLDTTYPRLVVEGAISSDTVSHLVKLSRTSDYFANKQLEPVKGATVTITDGTNIFTLTESIEIPGNYYTAANVFGIPGNTYVLNITNVDIDRDGSEETYSATSKMMPVIKVDSISVHPIRKFFTDFYEVRFNAPEPAETKDFYMFRLIRNGKMVTDTVTETSFTDDQFFNGIYIENQPVYNLFPGKEDEKLAINDTIVLETCAITKEHYEFLYDVMMTNFGSDPFGGQPANVRSNINDKAKAVGFFAAYDIKRLTTFVKDTIK